MSLYEMRNTVAGRVAGTLAAFALVLSLSFGGALNAQAQTTDLEAEIERLMGLIAQLQAQIAGGTTSTPTGLAGYQFARNLTPGSTGDDVMKLQQFLNANGAQVAAAGQAGAPGMETNYYGPATGAAVMKYQEAHRAEILTPLGLVTGTVNFGSSTRAYVNAQLASGTPTTPTTPGTPGTGDLQGGEGLIEVYDLSGNSTFGTGETEVVYEFEVEAVDSDVAVNRVDVLIGGLVSTSPDVAGERPWLIFDEVTLLADGKEVGSLTRERDYTRTTVGGDNYWRARFSGLDVVVEEGDTVEFTVEATAVSAIRGTATELETVVMVDRDGIRAVDAVGLVIYNDTALGTAFVKVEDSFGDGDLYVEISDNSPESSDVFEVDTEELVGAFEVEAEDGDMTLYSATITPQNTTATIKSLRLDDGSRTYTGREASGVYTFDFGRNGISVREGRLASFDVLAEFSTTGVFELGNVDVSGENSDYVTKTDGVTFTDQHNVIDKDSFSVVRASNNNFYVSPSDREAGRIGIEFTVKAAKGSGNDVTIDANDPVAAAAAAKKIVASLTGAGNTGSPAPAIVYELASQNGTILSGDQVVRAGRSTTFRLYAYFSEVTGTPTLSITNVDQNAVVGEVSIQR